MSYSEEEIRLIVSDAKRLYKFRKDSEPKEKVDFDNLLDEVIRRNGHQPTRLLKELISEEWLRQKEEREQITDVKKSPWDRNPVRPRRR